MYRGYRTLGGPRFIRRFAFDYENKCRMSSPAHMCRYMCDGNDLPEYNNMDLILLTYENKLDEILLIFWACSDSSNNSSFYTLGIVLYPEKNARTAG